MYFGIACVMQRAEHMCTLATCFSNFWHLLCISCVVNKKVFCVKKYMTYLLLEVDELLNLIYPNVLEEIGTKPTRVAYKKNI